MTLPLIRRCRQLGNPVASAIAGSVANVRGAAIDSAVACACEMRGPHNRYRANSSIGQPRARIASAAMYRMRGSPSAQPSLSGGLLALLASKITFSFAMPVAIDLDSYLVPPTLPGVSLMSGQEPPAIYHELLSEGFAAAGHCWADLKRQEDEFERLYIVVEDGAEPADIRTIADNLERHKQRTAAVFMPGLQQIASRLQHYRAIKRRHQAVQSALRLGEETIAIGTAWLELLQNARLRLLRLASSRDSEPPSPIFDDADAAMRHLRSAISH